MARRRHQPRWFTDNTHRARQAGPNDPVGALGGRPSGPCEYARSPPGVSLRGLRRGDERTTASRPCHHRLRRCTALDHEHRQLCDQHHLERRPQHRHLCIRSHASVDRARRRAGGRRCLNRVMRHPSGSGPRPRSLTLRHADSPSTESSSPEARSLSIANNPALHHHSSPNCSPSMTSPTSWSPAARSRSRKCHRHLGRIFANQSAPRSGVNSKPANQPLPNQRERSGTTSKFANPSKACSSGRSTRPLPRMAA